MPKFTLLILLLSSSLIMLAAPVMSKEPGWSDYRILLQRYVKPGVRNGVRVNLVDYTGIAGDPRWQKVLNKLARFPQHKLKNKKERTAFYINAYNIMTIQLIVKNWPLKSIRDIGSFFSPVWKKNAGIVAGRKVSLSYIGQNKLRKLGDIRSYFALACGSTSCPDLRRQPYTARQLNRQLDDQARRFLNNSGKGLARSGSNVRVSKLFSWFEHDFNRYGGVRAFVKRYKAIPDRLTLRADLPYHWSINGS
jgi:hypothetical protein